jgi:holo-[acyl-carrier protein] synthase
VNATAVASAPAPDPAAGGRPAPGPRLLIGTDLVAVERIESLLADRDDLAQQLFTERELAYCAGRARRRADHLAARFAAKEAVMKALGVGATVPWCDIEVVNSVDGRPGLRLHGRAAQVARQRGVTESDISLSHTAGLAMACAVLVCAGKTERDRTLT